MPETKKAPSSASESELAHHALTHAAAHSKSPGTVPAKPLKQMHIKEAHTGGFHITRMHEDGQMTEHVAHDVDGIHDHVHEHFGQGEKGEAAHEAAGKGEKAGGTDKPTHSKPDGAQGHDEED